MPFETQKAAKNYPGFLYSFIDCGAPCTSAEGYLEQRDIPFTLKNSKDDKTALEKLTGDKQIAVLVVGNQKPLEGYQE